MSLRDNATHTLVTMVKQFSVVTYDQDDFRELISNGLVQEVKAGLKNKKEVCDPMDLYILVIKFLFISVMLSNTF